jgi:DNA polymerase (family X)
VYQQRAPSVRPDVRRETVQVVPRVDVLGQAGQIELLQAEPRCASRSVQRPEVLGVGQCERIRRPVARGDERGRRLGQLLQLVRRHAGKVGVDDRDGALERRERCGNRFALTNRRVADEHVADLLARRPHVEEHRPGNLRITEPRLAAELEGYDEGRHANGRLSIDNVTIADSLERYASLLDLAGSSYYSVRAYRRVAELIRALPTPVDPLVRNGRARELRGIGPGLEARLRELVETGEIAHARELEGEVEPELVGLGRFLGLSPKRAVAVGRALNARTAAELREAVASGRLTEVPGIGPKTADKLRAALERESEAQAPRGLLLNRARELEETIATAVGGVAAGDPRRWCDVSNHFAVVAKDRASLDRFATLPQIVSIVERDATRTVGVTVEGIPIELVVAEPPRFGTELVRATGSREFVESLGALPDAANEEGVFAALGLAYVPPELREGRYSPPPPALVELEQIRGDLHVHTTWSDGRAGVLEMAEAARDRGYEYLAICDHTRNVRVVPGLDAEDVRRQGEEIAAANEAVAPFRVLRGIECDILPDGTLDLPDDVLVELDWVQASVHAGQRATRDAMTKRVVEALRHPSVSCLSHPKGRIINHRPENALDLERVFEVALEEAKAVEVNGLPDRLDLRDVHVRLAVEAGVPIVCATDAHSVRGLGNMQLSVATARRGGAAPGDVLNTRRLEELPRQ